jgi:hypothetical protein
MKSDLNAHCCRKGEGSFVISIFRRNAAKQKEVERQFENSMAQLRVKGK